MRTEELKVKPPSPVCSPREVLAISDSQLGSKMGLQCTSCVAVSPSSIPMLTSFSMQNFRAFRSERIELRPLTVIIGANGLGKSTLFHPLLLLKQTLERTDTFITDDILINGNVINFGQARNLFYGWQTKEPISFSFDILDSEFLSRLHEISRRTHSIARNYIQGLWREISYIERDSSRLSKRSAKDRTVARDFIDSARKANSGLNTDDAISLLEQAEQVISRARLNSRAIEEELGFPRLAARDATRSRLLAALQILRDIEKNRGLFSDGVLTLRFEAALRPTKTKEESLRISTIGVQIKGLRLFELVLDDVGVVIKATSDVIDPLPRVAVEHLLKQRIKSDNESIFRGLGIESTGDYASEIIASCFSSVISKFNVSMSSQKLRYVPSLRFQPSRFYDKGNFDNLNRNAVRVINLLSKQSQLQSKINSWVSDHIGVKFSATEQDGILQKVGVHVPHLKEELSLADTGFGYSQIIPILVELASLGADGLAVIEQPEAHLHPSLQYEIADWMFEAACEENQNRRIVIETHSDHILRRLHRRALEGGAPSSILGLYYVERGEDGFATVRRVDPDSSGDIEWPSGFSADANKDTLAIIRELNK
jgi:predicted ATPase